MKNLTQIEVTYSFDYGSVSQKRSFVTREHWDSLKALTRPMEEEIKRLFGTINSNTSKEIVGQVRNDADRLEGEIKKIIPSYHFIVEDSMVGSAIASSNENEYVETTIPYNDRPTCRVKYSIIR